MYVYYCCRSEREKKWHKKKKVITRKVQVFNNMGRRFPKNGDFYFVSPVFAVKARPSRHLP